MEYLAPSETSSSTPATILCCKCGTAIEPNPSSMCVSCIRTDVDITEGIARQNTIQFCKKCGRYFQPPNFWVKAELESKELLSYCLKRIVGLNKVRLTDASFIWTEPHSKRVKLKLTIQKEVINGAILQQMFPVEFIVAPLMCEDCQKVERKDFWRAVVQVRQKANHKKTLFYLEQLLLKHKAHTMCSNIKMQTDGIDFYFAEKRDARKLVDFLVGVVPCRYQTSQQLISHDTHSNLYNYKHAFSVEIAPICKDDIVCLPPKLAQMLGNIAQICVVLRVTQSIYLIDPNTTQIAELNSTAYWRYPFKALVSYKQLCEFVTLDNELITNKPHGPISVKHKLGDVWVAKASEMCDTSKEYFCRTHLGHLLKPGDSVLGFDFTSSNFNNEFIEKVNPDKLPDVVLVKKCYDRDLRKKHRQWRLKHLEQDHSLTTDSSVGRDLADFIDDLEEDADLRTHVDLYLDKNAIPVEKSADDMPGVSLDELIRDFHVDDGNDVAMD